jgi:hypothetical protein
MWPKVLMPSGDVLRRDQVSMVPADGKTLVMWTAAQQANSQLNHYRQHSAFSSPITCLHWHPNQPGHVAFGHQDGTLSFYTAGIRHTHTLTRANE